MRLFVSRRERWLWACAVLVVSVVYLTLGVVRDLLQPLVASGWGPWLFLSGCFLVLVFVLTQGMTILPRWPEIVAGVGIAVVYGFALTSIAKPEERMHLIIYGIIALLIYAALLERSAFGRNIFASSVVVVIATTILGLVDECLQLALPDRVFDVRDIFYDALAAAMAVMANASLRWARVLFR